MLRHVTMSPRMSEVRSACARLLPALLLPIAGCGNVYLDPEPPYREVLLEMEAELPLAAPERLARVWLPVPVTDESQELGSLQVRSVGGDVLERYDAKGNRILSVTGTPPLSISYVVMVRRFRVAPPHESHEHGELPRSSPWLEAARRAPLELVRKGALFVAAPCSDVLGKARRLYDSVIDRLRAVDAPRPNSGDLASLLQARSGDSADFHTLFVASCQSVGIPATFECGFALPRGNAETSITDQQRFWARFYVPGMRWLPVDAWSAKQDPAQRDFFFGGLTEDRVRLTRGRDLMLEPPQAAGRLDFFVAPYAELDMKDVTNRLRWQLHVRRVAPR